MAIVDSIAKLVKEKFNLISCHVLFMFIHELFQIIIDKLENKI